MDIYVARQPIFNRNMDVFGYELLYRSSTNNFYEGSNYSDATAELVHTAFLSMGLDKLTDGTKAFINFTQDLLETEIPRILPQKKIIIEVLETVDATEELIEACRKLKRDGYTIALDDFVLDKTLDFDYTPLIELADIIKIEFTKNSKIEQIKLIKKYENEKLFLAEKLETRQEFEEALKYGYDMFQGYFFSKPVMVQSKEIGTINMHMVHILDELSKEEPNFNYISDNIEKDMGLSVKLLTMANSVQFGGQKEISSIRLAVTRLGIQEMKRWISLMLLRDFENNENREIIKLSLLRGRLMTLMGEDANHEEDGTNFFLTGLLSSIDVILCNPKEKILDAMALSEDVVAALLQNEGLLADYLNCVLHYERFEFVEASKMMEKINMTMERFMELYIEALDWLKTTDD